MDMLLPIWVMEQLSVCVSTLFNHWILSLLALLVAYMVYDYIKKCSIRSSIGLPGPPLWPIVGNLPFFMRFSGESHIAFNKVMEEYGENVCIILFNQVMVVTGEPEATKEISVKAFADFHDRTKGGTGLPEPFASGMTALTGERWKSVRNIITPSFTVKKLRNMFFIMDSAGETLVNKLKKVAEKKEAIDILRWLQLATMEVMISASFGMATEAQTNEDDKIIEYARRAVKPPSGFMQLVMQIPIIRTIIVRYFLLSKYVFDVKDFVRVTEELVAQRKSIEASSEGAIRYDLLHLMLEAQREDTKGYVLSDNEVIGQSFIFLLAGQETTANALTFTLYLMAIHPEHQQKAQEEIDALVASDKELTYDHVKELVYLEACIAEALRLYPPAIAASRVVTNDCTLLGMKLKKGYMMMMATYYLHKSPKYWEDPEEFKPERFLNENKDNINPYVYAPFGQGPRNCIGMRFALLELKTLAAFILKNFSFKPAPDLQIPIKLTSRGLLRPVDPLKLLFTERVSEVEEVNNATDPALTTID